MQKLCGDQVQYQEVNGSFFVDKLLGTDLYRTGAMSAMELTEHFKKPIEAFTQKVQPFLLY